MYTHTPTHTHALIYIFFSFFFCFLLSSHRSNRNESGAIIQIKFSHESVDVNGAISLSSLLHQHTHIDTHRHTHIHTQTHVYTHEQIHRIINNNIWRERERERERENKPLIGSASSSYIRRKNRMLHSINHISNRNHSNGNRRPCAMTLILGSNIKFVMNTG